MYIYTFLISLLVTEIREGVGIRRGSVIGDFPLCYEKLVGGTVSLNLILLIYVVITLHYEWYINKVYLIYYIL